MSRLFGFLAILLTMGSLSNSIFASQWVKGKTGHAEARLLSSLDSIPDELSELLLGLEFKLSDGWHIYWKNAGDVGFAPRLSWQLPDSWIVGELQYPLPLFFPAENPEVRTASFGYENAVTYLVELQKESEKAHTESNSSYSFQVQVDFLICKEECIPDQLILSTEVQSGDLKQSKFHPQLTDKFEALPQLRNDYRFEQISENQFELVGDGLPQNPDAYAIYASNHSGLFWTAEFEGTNKYLFTLENSAPESIDVTEIHFRNNFGEAIQVHRAATSASTSARSFWIALVFAFLGGAILNLMPCVLPVLVLKTNSLLQLRAQSKPIKSSLSYTIAGIIFSFAVLAFVIGLIQLLGQQVSWGFQFQSPGFIAFMALIIFVFALNLFGLFEIQLPTVLNSKMTKNSGPFFEGVFATLLATPCSAPFLGTALAFALSQNFLTLLIFFVVMGLGLATPYVLFLVSPALISLLPKPGTWMLSLKRYLGYSLVLALFWMLWILAQQTGQLFLFGFSVLLLILLIIIAEMKSPLRWLVVMALSIAGIFIAEQQALSSSEALGSHRSTSSEERSFSVEKLEQLQAEHPRLFINITADWCLTCKYNEKLVLETDWFEALLKEHDIYFWEIDWTRRDPAVGQFLEQKGRAGIPFAMIYNQKQEHLLPELLTRKIVVDQITALFKP